MADTASLIVRVSSTGVDKTTSQLNGLTKAAGAAAAAPAALVSPFSCDVVLSTPVDDTRTIKLAVSAMISTFKDCF